MPISASQIVQVNPRLLKPGGKDLEFNGLILSKNTDIPTGTVLAFGEPSGVAAYFGETSIEYQMANVYFLGYTNSFIKPRALYFARRVDAPASAFLRGVQVNLTVAQIKALADQVLTITIGTHTATLDSLSFGAITSYSDAALVLQGAIRAETTGGEPWVQATVAYSSLYKAFTIKAGDAGAESLITYATGTLASNFSFTETAGALLSQGSAQLTEAQNMNLVLDQTQNFVNFTPAWLPTESEVLAFATWANSKGVAYLFLYSDTDPKLLQAGNTQTIAAALKNANLGSVAGQYAGVEYSAFIMGVGASIDWNRIQGTITTAFKGQDGLPATVKNSTTALNLIAQGMNFVGDYATRNDNFIFNYPGQMFGTYSWIDTYWNAVWLNNAIQAALLSGLSQSPRTPYTEGGYALVRAWLQDPINRGLRNGVIDPGLNLSEQQKAQINREAGQRIDDSVATLGYYSQVLDPGANARLNRDTPIINLWYAYGGSINRLVVASTALV